MLYIRPRKQQSKPAENKPQQSPSEERREFEKNLESYACTFSKRDEVDQLRNLGLEHGLTTCEMAKKLIREGQYSRESVIRSYSIIAINGKSTTHKRTIWTL